MSFFAEKNKVGGLERIYKTLFYSRDGLLAACKEPAFVQLLVLHSVLVLLALFLVGFSQGKMLLIAVSFLSLIVELINTSIEAIVDRVSTELHPLSKIAKDCGSAAQLLILVLCAILWLMVLFA